MLIRRFRESTDRREYNILDPNVKLTSNDENKDTFAWFSDSVLAVIVSHFVDATAGGR